MNINTKSNRHNQQQIWADKDFVKWIRQIKGKFEAQGIEVASLGEITQKLIRVPTIEELERQILQSQNFGELKIKMDSRRFMR